MVEFVLEQSTRLGLGGDTYSDFSKKVINYAKSLSQTPRLGHFIPCDENDVPMEEPKICCSGRDCGCMGFPYNYSSEEELQEYQQACDRVLFDGFECKKAEFCDELIYEVFKENLYIMYDPDEKKIEIECFEFFANSYEDLVKYNFLLTESGANFFGL